MKLLFIPTDGFGHVNACLGLAHMLSVYGYESIFAVPSNWSDLIKSHSFAVQPINPNVDATVDPQILLGVMIKTMAPTFAKPPVDQVKDIFANNLKMFCDGVKKIDDSVESIIKQVNPDLILIDFYVTVPSVINSGIPWVLLYSANPLFAYESPVNPPRFSGYGATDDSQLFQQFRQTVAETVSEVKADYDSYLISKGVAPDTIEIGTISPYLNLYSFPEDLDYSELGPVPDKWFRLDHMVREAEGGLIGFDEYFFETNDKVVFFSLGSMGGADVTLMNRLISFMSESKHRFIVSKGPFHEEIKLSDNMIGGKYLNQIKILPKVDLVITHGGNNTFIESLYFGKPCIVLPLFGDQHDNARRAIDKRIGKAFGPYQVTKEQFLDGIDEILNDQELIERVQIIGEKIRNTKSHKQLSDRLNDLVVDQKTKKVSK